jgi:hypothetical protein
MRRPVARSSGVTPSDVSSRDPAVIRAVTQLTDDGD